VVGCVLEALHIAESTAPPQSATATRRARRRRAQSTSQPSTAG
jgi:hypothetical protein